MASLKWTVKGRVETTHLMPELEEIRGRTAPLDGVTVKVQARSKIPFGWGTWASWGTVHTNSNGEFSVSENHGSDRRQFRVKVCYDDGRLRVKEGQETSISFGGNGFPIDIQVDLTDKDWYEIHNDKTAEPDGRRAGTHDLGTLRMSTRRSRQLGDIWTLLSMTLDRLEGMGEDFGKSGKSVVKFPMGIGNNSSATDSYANPLNNHVYIKSDQLHARTLLHEFFHTWMYERTTGEDGMAWQLAKHGTTHDAREATTFVPFHEAFADFAAYRMIKLLSGGALTRFLEDNSQSDPVMPFSRSHLGAPLKPSERNLDNVDFTERGWFGLFTLLMYDRVRFLDLNVSGTYAANLRVAPANGSDVDTDLTFRQVLDILNTHPEIPLAARKWRNSSLNFDDFLARAKAVRPDQLNDEVVATVLTCLDPNATENPGAASGPGLILRDARPGIRQFRVPS